MKFAYDKREIQKEIFLTNKNVNSQAKKNKKIHSKDYTGWRFDINIQIKNNIKLNSFLWKNFTQNFLNKFINLKKLKA